MPFQNTKLERCAKSIPFWRFPGGLECIAILKRFQLMSLQLLRDNKATRDLWGKSPFFVASKFTPVPHLTTLVGQAVGYSFSKWAAASLFNNKKFVYRSSIIVRRSHSVCPLSVLGPIARCDHCAWVPFSPFRLSGLVFQTSLSMIISMCEECVLPICPHNPD